MTSLISIIGRRFLSDTSCVNQSFLGPVPSVIPLAISTVIRTFLAHIQCYAQILGATLLQEWFVITLRVPARV